MRAFGLTCAAALILTAQSDLWTDGQWSVAAPPGGNCGRIPILIVRGPGSIFDPANAQALAAMQKALPASLAPVCAGARDVMVISGRTRRMLRLAEPTETAPPAAGVPTSALGSLSSAKSTEDKCEVLFNWLESAKTDAAAVNRYRQGPEMLAIFRDEPMTAVFGMPYDKTENRWRLEQHEKVISRCLGQQQPSRYGPFVTRPNRTLLQYAQQFQQYRALLDQAFLGTPGLYEPAAITRYLQQVRTQTEWARQAMASAAAAPPVRESFDRLTEQSQAVNRQNLLSAAEKSQLTAALAKRQAELAPQIAEQWFQQNANLPKSPASARTLHTSRAAMAPVLSAIEPAARAAFESKYSSRLESMIAEPLQADVSSLRAIPATLAGVLQVTAWKTRFDAAYRDLRGVPAVDTAAQEFVQARARVLTGALPAWMAQVQAIPAEGEAITAKRREMETLFPAREDRALPVYTQFETPLRAKEDQLRLRVEADMRKQQEQQAAAAQRQQLQQAPAQPAAPTSSARGRATGPVNEASFSAKGLHNEATIANIYRGDFLKIGFDRDDLNFMSMYGQYLDAYGRKCDAFLPANKVEIMTQRCTAETVTRNGYGVEVSRYCSNWVPEGTGVYADPVMYDAKKQLERMAAMDTFRNAGRLMTQMSKSRDPIAGAMNMVGNIQAIVADMRAVVEQNGCASAGLQRFEQNLKQFALNKPPIKLGEQGPKLSAIAPLPGVPYRDQNYARLIEDLVQDHSKTWVMNRYMSGSISGVSVANRDGQGRPAKITAAYTYNGFSGRSQGSVTVTFSDGLPECLYFFDFPATCRTPSRRIVAAYADGAYPQQ